VSNQAISSPSSWPLIWLAAICAEAAYEEKLPTSEVERPKCLERVVISKRNIPSCGRVAIVAIPGTQTLKDWKMNFNNNAAVPKGVLVCTPMVLLV
jgi:hypothetical protein